MAEAFVVTHRQEEPTWLGDASRVWPPDDLLGVGRISHLERDLEASVRPDLLIDHPTRLLGGQEKMHPQRTTDTGCRDQLIHESWFLLLELCELISYHDEMWARLRHPPLAEEV